MCSTTFNDALSSEHYCSSYIRPRIHINTSPTIILPLVPAYIFLGSSLLDLTPYQMQLFQQS